MDDEKIKQLEQLAQAHDEKCRKILDDKSTSNWLVWAINSLSQRDPVDAACDVDLLHTLVEERMKILTVKFD